MHGAFAESASWNGVIAGAVDTIESAGSAQAISVSHPDQAANLIHAAVKHITG